MSNNTITAPTGFRANGVACGLKASGDPDLGIIAADEPCAAAAVFTRNRFCGAPITVGREHVRDGRLGAIVANSGCANVATGKRGITDAQRMCKQVAQTLNVSPYDVLPASTGVIGEFLPMAKVRQGIEAALAGLSSTQTAGRRFARAILTTDTKIKQACERIRIGRDTVVVAGCCKGSGMIAPNMATMLGHLTTDAKIPAGSLKRLLKEAVDPTFNRVTIDECESTSDTVVIMASGKAAKIASKRNQEKFAKALLNVCDSLAYQIAADGEGATRVLEVIVTGAKTAGDAHAAARAIAVSPLVKTAIHGCDPNWGRIVQSLGMTSVTYGPERVVVRMNDTVLFRKGAPAPRLDIKKLSQLMRRKHVAIRVELGAGKAHDRVLTCDLSREYITVNADYHT